MEPEDLEEAAATLRRILALLPPGGLDDVAMAHRVEGAATALEAAAMRCHDAEG